MAPGTPIHEQIMADVETALTLITTVGDAYFHDVSTKHIKRAEAGLPDIEKGPFPLILVSSGDNRNVGDSNAGADALFAEELDIQIEAYISTRSNVAAKLRQLERDIRTAMWADPFRSSLAHFTKWTSTEPFYPLNNEPIAGVVLQFTIQFQTNQADLSQAV